MASKVLTHHINVTSLCHFDPAKPLLCSKTEVLSGEGYMLHTKPQGHWPFGSGEEDLWRVFTIYGRCCHLGHVTQTPLTNFRPPTSQRLHMKFGFDWPSGFGEGLWKWWTDNGRTDDGPWLYYKLTNEPKRLGWANNLKRDPSERQHPKFEKADSVWLCLFIRCKIPHAAQPRVVRNPSPKLKSWILHSQRARKCKNNNTMLM